LRSPSPATMNSKSCGVEEIFARSRAALGRKGLDAAEFGSISSPAQPFFAALLARSGTRRSWFICESIREQEDFAGELAQWDPRARAFPELPAFGEGEEILHDPETAAERLDLLSSLCLDSFVGPIVIAASQLDEEVPDPAAVAKGALRLARGGRADPAALAGQFAEAGYEAVPQAAVRGQFSLRGGILDVFSWQASSPVRIEFDDEVIDSLREYDPDTQISLREADYCEVLLRTRKTRKKPLRELFRKADLIAGIGEVEGPAVRIFEGGEGGPEFFPPPFGELGAGDLVLDSARAGLFFRELEAWRQSGWMVVLAAASEGEAARFHEFASERGEDTAWMNHLPVPLARGFIHPGAKLAVLSAAALFGRAVLLRGNRLAGRRHKASAARAATDFSDFEEGDHVVHLDHGIGRFEGFVDSPDGSGESVMAIAYAGDARLYVPLPQAWQVSRYAGLGRSRVDLSELGSPRWTKTKEKAVASVFDYAARMLRVQAERQTIAGHAFGPDTHWQSEFESAFPYKETADQLRATAECKRDMESPRPTDRLVCGDVGFGKTEVAVRAIFKAVMGGKQAALLAPTTVLARQHFQTLRERASDYPVTVELLSRYRTAAEQKRVLARLAEGGVDIVVGTHRLVSPDVIFRDLGLVVVDEEQRFGVKHKDLLKERFRQVDVITLSATPIPRTLYMALSGARDMSLIETPPPNRQPVETVVCAYDERVFRDAINRELERGGQIYFLHNRVRTIEKVAARIRELCPSARVAVGHGQMAEGELESVMSVFVAGKADVLVSTTIIESGLDIPNANTIIIDRADLFGLADLYQLRGRVGRAGAKAYAYLMLPRDLLGAARKRVSAIKQYSDLGSGFKIAMRDLELRGAGNLLGTAQSGHIIAVGFDFYCKLLRRAVDALGGAKRFSRNECAVRLDFVRTEEAPAGEPGKADAFLPASYIPDAKTRIACYRQLVETEDSAGLELLQTHWRDRFGPLPAAVTNALAYGELGIEGARRRLVSIEVKEGKLMLSRKGGFIQPGGRFPRLTEKDAASRLREALRYVEDLPIP